MREENVKVVIAGLGGVGKRILKELTEKEGVDVVGVIDYYEAIVGKDAGEVAGIEPIGVLISDKEDEVYETTKPDIALNCAKGCNNAYEPFQQIRSAIEHGVNVIVANSDTSQMWESNPELAKEIDEEAKKHGVTYCGIGSTQVLERIVLSMTEGAQHLNSVHLVHHADVHAFDAESNKRGPGIGLTKEEYDARTKMEQDNAKEQKDKYEFWEQASIRYLCERLGWKIEKITSEKYPDFDENGLVYKTTQKYCGYDADGVLRMQADWEYILDPDKRYYQKVELDSIPSIDCTIELSPDRGLASTAGSMKNAIPHVINAEPGYLTTLDLPVCSDIEGDYRNYIK